MSYQGQPTDLPFFSRVPSNPPVPPTVLLRNYASTSSLASPTPRTRVPMNHRPYSYTGNDAFPTNRAHPRTRRVSEPSRDPVAPSYPSPFPHFTVSSAARRRPQPKHLAPRPASASYAPRRPSPLACPDPPPNPEAPHDPGPIVDAYPPAPIVDSIIMPNHNTPLPAGPDLRTYENAVPPPLPPTMAPRPKRRKLEKRRVKEHGLPDATTSHGCGLSFAGLSSLFSKKESCPTPNMLLLKHHYTEQYIPPGFDGVRYRKNPKD